MLNRDTLAIHGFCLMAVAIIVMAIVPGAFAHQFLSGTVKHVLAFAVLSIFALALWPQVNPVKPFLALIALGGGIELLQASMALGRVADWGDWISDVLACTVVFAGHVILRRFPALDPLAVRRARAQEIAELRALIRGLDAGV